MRDIGQVADLIERAEGQWDADDRRGSNLARRNVPVMASDFRHANGNDEDNDRQIDECKDIVQHRGFLDANDEQN